MSFVKDRTGPIRPVLTLLKMRFLITRHPHSLREARGVPLSDRVAATALILALLGLVALVFLATSAEADSGGAPPGQKPGVEMPEPPVGPEPPLPPVVEPELPVQPPLKGRRSAFNKAGMWIWYLSSSHGGDYRQIIRQARQAGIGTLYIKSADGRNVWSQFTRAMVKRFQRAGLKVCGWHYVYGDYPAREARASAAAARRGADCFVIDAEAEYEGKYASADRYIRTLRRLVGKKYPIALTGFPYVDYHPSFPYSVFLGPGGAQVNQPQMYWKAIGVSVRTVFEHTYIHNRLFKRPIRPLGQTYQRPTARDIKSFRRFNLNYRTVPSWWSWQETQAYGWRALGSRTAGRLPGLVAVNTHPVLKRGSRGDLVVWAQQHLKRKIAPNLPVTGAFMNQTHRAVRELQRRRGLKADGILGTETWRHLLRFKPVRTRWWIPPRKGQANRSGAVEPAGGVAGASGASGRSLARLRAPRSASMPARAYEIPPKSSLDPGR